MIEKSCSLWAEPAKYRCIPTNGSISDGKAVMDSGIAQKFVGLSSDLGRLIASRGNHVQIIRPEIVAFPIKQYEWQDIVSEIVKRSVQELIELVESNKALLLRFWDKDHPARQEIENILSSLPDNIVLVK